MLLSFVMRTAARNHEVNLRMLVTNSTLTKDGLRAKILAVLDFSCTCACGTLRPEQTQPTRTPVCVAAVAVRTPTAVCCCHAQRSSARLKSRILTTIRTPPRRTKRRRKRAEGVMTRKAKTMRIFFPLYGKKGGTALWIRFRSTLCATCESGAC